MHSIDKILEKEIVESSGHTHHFNMFVLERYSKNRNKYFKTYLRHCKLTEISFDDYCDNKLSLRFRKHLMVVLSFILVSFVTFEFIDTIGLLPFYASLTAAVVMVLHYIFTGICLFIPKICTIVAKTNLSYLITVYAIERGILKEKYYRNKK